MEVSKLPFASKELILSKEVAQVLLPLNDLFARSMLTMSFNLSLSKLHQTSLNQSRAVKAKQGP
jgi:hypothetical protein